MRKKEENERPGEREWRGFIFTLFASEVDLICDASDSSDFAAKVCFSSRMPSVD